MHWMDIDIQQQERGFNLQINRHYSEWKALYVSQTALPASHRADNLDEAVRGAAELTGWCE